jgi:MATE family multidrug resistance protein
LVRLAWPLVVSLLSYSVMTLVDTLFVARLGATSLAAVGLGGMAMFSVLIFGMGVFAGAKIRVSEAVGGGQRDGLEAHLGGFLRLALALGVVSTVLAVGVAMLLPTLHENPEAGALSRSYCAIRSLAIPLALLTQAIAQYRQALGESQSAMRAALLANLVNIPLNALLVIALGWGSDGAALASVLSRIAELAVLLSVQKREGLGWREGSISRALSAFRYGLPMGVERWLDVAAFAALVALLARMGEVELAAHQITLQILHFGFLPMIALSDALSVLVAQASGAREHATARYVLGYSLRLGLVYSATFALGLMLFDTFLIGLFSAEPALVATARKLMWVGALLQLLHVSYLMLRGALRGLGDLKYVAWVTVGCAWIFTPPLTWAFGFTLGLGAQGGWLALCFEVVAGLCLVVYRLRTILGSSPA